MKNDYDITLLMMGLYETNEIKYDTHRHTPEEMRHLTYKAHVDIHRTMKNMLPNIQWTKITGGVWNHDKTQ